MEGVDESNGSNAMEEDSEDVQDDIKQLFSKLSAICKQLEQKGEKVVVLTTTSNNGMGVQHGKELIPGTSDMLTKFQHFCEGQDNSPSTDSAILKTEPLVNNDKSSPSESDRPGENVEPAMEIYVDNNVTPDVDNDGYDDMFSSESITQLDDHCNAGFETSTDFDEINTSLKEGNDNTDTKPPPYVNIKPLPDVETHLTFNEVDLPEHCSIERRSVRIIKRKQAQTDIEVLADVKPHHKTVQSIQTSGCKKQFPNISKSLDHCEKIHDTTETGMIIPKDSMDKPVRNGRQGEKLFETASEGPQCIRVMDDKTNSKEPVVGSYSQTQVVCQKCKTGFTHIQHLKHHIRKIPNCVSEFKDVEVDQDIDRLNILYKDEQGNQMKVPFVEILNAQNKVPYNCIVCKTAFNRKSNLKRHLLKHSDFHLPACNICGVQFKNRDNHIRHMKDHNEKPFHCEKCDKQRFETEKALAAHFKKCVKYSMVDLTCSTCGHMAKCRAALKIHQNVHLGVKPYSCEHCGKKMSSSTSLERHIMCMHQDETPFECEICHKTFKVKDNYKKHLKHHEEPKYKCEICGKTCVEFGNLKKHMLSHTKEKPFVCEICGNSYGRRALLDNHRRLHTGEKPYKCKEQSCGKTFRSYANLRQHERYHSKDQPYVCEVCGKAFKQPGRMSHHRKSHFVEYRWPCAYCTEKYKTIFMYKSHLAKEHPQMKKDIEDKTNIKLYQCHICQKVYGDKEDLTRHIYIHEGLKPFKCEHCSKCFNDKSNLKQHVKTHLNERKFTCNICQKSFVLKKILRAHLCNTHGVKHLNKFDVQQQKTSGQLQDVKEHGNLFVIDPSAIFTQDNQLSSTIETHVIVQKEPSANELLGTPNHLKLHAQPISILERKDQSDTESDIEQILPHFKLLQQASGEQLITMEYHPTMHVIG